MKRIERVDSVHATRTEESDRLTIKAAIHAFLAAEFAATIVNEYSFPFESYELLEVKITFSPP